MGSEGDVLIAGGYRLETRKVGIHLDGPMVRELYVRGEHSKYCQVQDEGWVCDAAACTIEDMPGGNRLEVISDELIEVHEDTWRDKGWKKLFIVRWKMTRVSLQRKFVNGRSVDENADYTVDTWYQGMALTRWGARRKMKRQDA